jgi:hypothetical protein
MANLLRAQCGCIIATGYKQEEDATFATAFVIRDCYNGDFTFRERVIRVDSGRPKQLSAEEESAVWNELRKLVDDGNKLRELRSAFNNVFSNTEVPK